mgnify:CR=1 FL=1
MLKLKLSELKKLEWNPRTIKKEDLDKLTKSIEKFWVIEWRPFLVSNRTGENIIIWGNQRYEVCKKLGIKEVPVHIMEWLSEEEEKEIIIRDNISNWEWDWDILANEWDKEELEEWGLDVQFETVESEAEEDDFEVDEGIKTDIVLWDLFEIGSHRLLCWDSTNIDDVNKLMNGEKADMVFTDPPYWVEYEWINNDDRGWLEDLLRASFWNYMISSKEWASFYCFHSDRCADIFHKVYREYCHFSSMIIWEKESIVLSQTDYQSKHEPCLYWWFDNWTHKFYWDRKQESIWIEKSKKEEWHTTPKPIGIVSRWVKNSSKEWMIILDLFWWSGSTMVACHQLNRRCYMSELDPKYVQTIVNRMIKLDSTLEIKRNWLPYENTI